MKKQTKHEKIIALYKEGMKPKDIAAKLKINDVQQVYAAKYLENKKIDKKIKTVAKNVLIKHDKSITELNQMMEKWSNGADNKTFGTIVHRPEPMGPIELVKEKSFFQKIKDFLGV